MCLLELAQKIEKVKEESLRKSDVERARSQVVGESYAMNEV